MKYELFFRYRVSMMSDDRVIALCEQNGIEGIGIYTVLLAELRQHEGYRCAFASLPALARRWNVSLEKLQKIVCDFRLFRLYAEDESGRSFSSIYLDEEMNTEPDTPVRNRISTGTDRRESAATGTAVAGATTAGGVKVTVKRAANGRFTATRCKKKNILKEKEEEEIIRAAPEPPSVPITDHPDSPRRKAGKHTWRVLSANSRGWRCRPCTQAWASASWSCCHTSGHSSSNIS